jgi:uncharacterized membrane protein YhaH (DUF805 family)
MTFQEAIRACLKKYAELNGRAMLLPQLAVGSRRLHDIGRSGWWLLFALVPVGGVVLLVILWAQPRAERSSEQALPG